MKWRCAISCLCSTLLLLCPLSTMRVSASDGIYVELSGDTTLRLSELELADYVQPVTESFYGLYNTPDPGDYYANGGNNYFYKYVDGELVEPVVNGKSVKLTQLSAIGTPSDEDIRNIKNDLPAFLDRWGEIFGICYDYYDAYCLVPITLSMGNDVPANVGQFVLSLGSDDAKVENAYITCRDENGETQEKLPFNKDSSVVNFLWANADAAYDVKVELVVRDKMSTLVSNGSLSVSYLPYAWYNSEDYPHIWMYKGFGKTTDYVEEGKVDWQKDMVITIVNDIENPSFAFPAGDIDCSGDVDVLDIVSLQKSLHTSHLMNERQRTLADINGDDIIDIFDLALLKRKILET